ncbi:hypothetical protein [Massilia sp. YIM B04103]|uniref:hypothetical protein n=1 Tax=Massilia sp. YIM B04103 TaxID=2963106 RepID=UPI00210E9E3C|nr:hypothetical protein [Massilia sp. YIM B04103]
MSSSNLAVLVTQTLQEALNAQNTIAPASTQWQACLQSVYNQYLPALDQFAQAIYTAWTTAAPVPAIADRVTFNQLSAGLLALKDGQGNQIFDADDVNTAVNAFYMEVSILVDAAGLSGAYLQNGETYDATQYIFISDNHPSTSIDEHGPELDDEGLAPNMTVNWSASTLQGSPVQLVQFIASDPATWSLLMYDPIQLAPGSANQWVAYAKPKLQPNTTAVYHFQFTIPGSNNTYTFDPYIGDDREPPN